LEEAKEGCTDFVTKLTKGRREISYYLASRLSPDRKCPAVHAGIVNEWGGGRTGPTAQARPASIPYAWRAEASARPPEQAPEPERIV
jgi:hypothetical protein